MTNRSLKRGSTLKRQRHRWCAVGLRERSLLLGGEGHSGGLRSDERGGSAVLGIPGLTTRIVSPPLLGRYDGRMGRH